jgi:glycosyltransferase involved in cell wall biosynthesis
MKQKTSVIIPHFGMLDTLQRAIESAFAAGANFVIQVPDGDLPSLDDMPNHEHQSVLRRMIGGRMGVPGARNVGIYWSAPDDLIIPLDADDELLPGAINVLKAAWQPGTWVYGGWIEVEADGTETVISAPPPQMLNRKTLCHATMLFHRDDWAKVGGYDPDFNIGGEDWAFQVALTAAGVRPVRVDQPIYRRHIGVNARTGQARQYGDVILRLLRDKYPTVMR